jgi:hypothetical protein
MSGNPDGAREQPSNGRVDQTLAFHGTGPCFENASTEDFRSPRDGLGAKSRHDHLPNDAVTENDAASSKTIDKSRNPSPCG